MEIYVILNELEGINAEIHGYSDTINNISSTFNVTCQELMDEIDSELDAEISATIEETKKLSEKINLELKSHENFILDAYNEYSYIEKESLIAIENIGGFTLGNITSAAVLPRVVVPYTSIVPYRILELLPWLWPNTKPVRLLNRKKTAVIIPNFFCKVEQYDDISVRKIFICAFIAIAPNAIIDLINDLLPVFGGEFNAIKPGNGTETVNAETSNGMGSNFEEISDEIGNAEKVNYNLIKAWFAAEIINYIISEYTFISEMIKYKTLGALNGIKSDDDEDKTVRNENTEETVLNESEGKNTEKKDFRDYTVPVENITKNDETRNKHTYQDTNINTGAAAAFGGGYAAYKTENYFSAMNGVNEGRNKENVKENKKNFEMQKKTISENASRTQDKKATESNYKTSSFGSYSDTASYNFGGVGSGAVSFGGYSSNQGGEDNYYAGMSDPDIIEGNINISEGFFSYDDDVSHNYSQKTKSDVSAAFNYKADKLSIIYQNIAAASSGASGASGAKTLDSLEVLSAGAVGTAGAGTLGSLLFNAFGSSDVEDAIKCVAGAMKYTNLFDMVGKAERCRIGWLGEITNILAQ